MNLRLKNIIYTLGLMSALFLVWHYRQDEKPPLLSIEGKTMGTTYHIKYFDKEARNLQPQIDSLLEIFNQSLSTYLSTSEISQLNNDSVFYYDLPFFREVVSKSAEISSLTSGAFDPTVMPLVNAWGFGPEERVTMDSSYIDSLKFFIGFDKMIKFDNNKVWKLDNRATLDFSAIAKGYGVDVVTEFITHQGIINLFVEIGGEVNARGRNLKTDNPWRIAIIHPESDMLQPTFIAQLAPGNKGIATSANNFNYRIIDGVKYSHTISPYSGYPIKQAILSATVVADDCMTADALATSFMVMGHEKAIELVNRQNNVGAFLIFSDSTGGIDYFVSENLKDKIKLLN
ncbi:MAG: FAD:protein FMN transferase [Cyclobacteriaceae bacterium]|nr:FAD:protein FMN transferase [Cyclobacteriaceae bacterium]